MFKWIIITAIFNIHSGALTHVTPEVNDQGKVIEYIADTPQESYAACSHKLMEEGVQKPDANGDIKLFQCLPETIKDDNTDNEV
jgi:hypothetical protein